MRYLRLCLARSAGVIIPTNETLTHPSEFTPEIGRYLKQVVESSSETVDHYLEIVHKLLSAAAGKRTFGYHLGHTHKNIDFYYFHEKMLRSPPSVGIARGCRQCSQGFGSKVC